MARCTHKALKVLNITFGVITGICRECGEVVHKDDR